MRPIQLHPLSILVGLGIATLAFVAMGQTPQVIDPVVRRPGQPSQVIAARDFVQIEEGTQYVVPAGKLFVPTALGVNNMTNVAVFLTVNGQLNVNAFMQTSTGEMSMIEVPRGQAIPAGSTIDVSDNAAFTIARAWGYLADA